MFFAISSFCVKAKLTAPPMGWTSWNLQADEMSEQTLKAKIDSFVAKGFPELGYKYIYLADGIIAPKRDASNQLVVDSNKFPNGLKAVADYAHSKGLKIALAGSVGEKSCKGSAGSFTYEQQDVDTFSAWGADLLRFDFCSYPLTNKPWAPDLGNLTIDGKVYPTTDAQLIGRAELRSDGYVGYIGNNDGEMIFTINSTKQTKANATIGIAVNEKYRSVKIMTNKDEKSVIFHTDFEGKRGEFKFTLKLKQGSNTIRFYLDKADKADLSKGAYTQVANAVEANAKEIAVFSTDNGEGMDWKWGNGIVSGWTTSRYPTYYPGYGYYAAILDIYDDNVNLDTFSFENAYNDPDFLVAGFKNITTAQAKNQFVLWSLMNAPLVVAADPTTLSDELAAILSNKNLIAINQDSKNEAATLVLNASGAHTLARSLSDGRVVLAFFNRNQKDTADFNIDIKALPTYIDIEDATAWNQAESFTVQDVFTGDENVIIRQLTATKVAPNTIQLFFIKMN